jgi:hypothetical protein
MTRETFAKIYKVLTKELHTQETDSKSSANALRLVGSGDSDSVMYVKTELLDTVLSDAQVDALKDGGFVQDAGRAVRISWGRKKEWAVGISWSQLEAHVKKASVDEAQSTLLQRRVKVLEQELKEARETSATDVALAHLLDSLAASYKSGKRRPTELVPFKRRATVEACEGLAVLVLSDWHWGEVVDPNSVEGLNAYNLEIADKRATRIVETALELLDPQEGRYAGIVVPILGDMLSGVIHDELLATNQEAILACVLSLVAKLEWALFQLAQHFPTVYAVCVYGNHGRMDKRKTHKKQAALNFETLVYKMLEQNLKSRLGDRCNVQFKIAESSDETVMLYGKRVLMTHGDQFDDLPGSAFDKVRAGSAMKRKRAESAGQPAHDFMLCGHFHTYGCFGGIGMNGSLVGYNEFAYHKNLTVERPQQALMVVHPKYGITRHMPVFADEPAQSKKAIAPVSAVNKRRVVTA